MSSNIDCVSALGKIIYPVTIVDLTYTRLLLKGDFCLN